jgi:hypothetical protein
VIGETGLVLLGYSGWKPGEPPNLDLYWQAQHALTKDYELDLTLRDERNEVLATWRRPLSSKIHPIKSWQPGEIVKLPFPLELTSELPAGPYRPVLSVFPANSSQTTPMAQINLAPNDED